MPYAVTMGLYLIALKKPPLKESRAKAPRTYWVLRETYWQPDLGDGAGGTRHRYITSIGYGKPKLTLAQAKRLCREKGLNMKALERIKGLQIVDDSTSGGEDAMRTIQRGKGSG